jgi:hypothetical protein
MAHFVFNFGHAVVLLAFAAPRQSSTRSTPVSGSVTRSEGIKRPLRTKQSFTVLSDNGGVLLALLVDLPRHVQQKVPRRFSTGQRVLLQCSFLLRPRICPRAGRSGNGGLKVGAKRASSGRCSRRVDMSRQRLCFDARGVKNVLIFG